MAHTGSYATTRLVLLTFLLCDYFSHGLPVAKPKPEAIAAPSPKALGEMIYGRDFLSLFESLRIPEVDGFPVQRDASQEKDNSGLFLDASKYATFENPYGEEDSAATGGLETIQQSFYPTTERTTSTGATTYHPKFTYTTMKTDLDSFSMFMQHRLQIPNTTESLFSEDVEATTESALLVDILNNSRNDENDNGNLFYETQESQINLEVHRDEVHVEEPSVIQTSIFDSRFTDDVLSPYHSDYHQPFLSSQEPNFSLGPAVQNQHDRDRYAEEKKSLPSTADFIHESDQPEEDPFDLVDILDEAGSFPPEPDILYENTATFSLQGRKVPDGSQPLLQGYGMSEQFRQQPKQNYELELHRRNFEQFGPEVHAETTEILYEPEEPHYQQPSQFQHYTVQNTQWQQHFNESPLTNFQHPQQPNPMLLHPKQIPQLTQQQQTTELAQHPPQPTQLTKHPQQLMPLSHLPQQPLQHHGVATAFQSGISVMPEGQPHTSHQEPVEQNYEVPEHVSVITNGRAHGVQSPSGAGFAFFDGDLSDRVSNVANRKFGYVMEDRETKKYRIEERTTDGYIVGEYGVVNNNNGNLRGVRYTADETINPRVLYDALMKFLSL